MFDTAPTKDELRMAEFMAEQELLSLVREAVDQSKLDRQEIARRLGVHKSNISRLLNSPSNMTVRLAARVVRAAGQRLTLGKLPLPMRGQSQAEGYAALGQNVTIIRPGGSTARSNRNAAISSASGLGEPNRMEKIAL